MDYRVNEPWYVRKARLAQQRNPQKHPVQLEIGELMEGDDLLERYQVYYKGAETVWSAFYMAENFGHAEEQANDEVAITGDEVVIIRKGDNVVSL